MTKGVRRREEAAPTQTSQAFRLVHTATRLLLRLEREYFQSNKSFLIRVHPWPIIFVCSRAFGETIGPFTRLFDMRHDLLAAFRHLAKTPGATALSALSVALGIGLSTGIFSVADAILRPTAIARPGELLQVSSRPTTATSWTTAGRII
jgi:hypothetical protein